MSAQRRIILTLVFSSLAFFSAAQDFGLSFSYFLPKNGYFSTPISPFSIRGLGFNITNFISVETGGSLYRMSGMNLKDLPFDSKEPLVGPNFTLLVPVELVFGLKANIVQLDLKGGGFFFYPFGNKINYGNLDRALATYEGWDIANADVSFDAKPGFGYHGGAELTLYVTQQVGVSLETNYFVGDSKFPLQGSYSGGSTAIETKTLDYAEAKMDFTGFEFSVGLIFSSGNTGPKGPKKRRRR
jgi:hypothetical protein